MTLSLMPKALSRGERVESNVLIRQNYRALINTGRTYAAFNNDELILLAQLKNRGQILDPMSGYGLISQAGSKLGIDTFSVELNPAQYFWQLLTNPSTAATYLNAVRKLQRKTSGWPKSRLRVEASDDWVTDTGLSLISKVFDETYERCQDISSWNKEKTLALLLPFLARFTCYRQGDTSSHVKKGGLCVYMDWQSDFGAYLHAIAHRLEAILSERSGGKQLIEWGDASSFLSKRKFKGMLTSPPYPNAIDYIGMFEPEHVVLGILRKHVKLRTLPNREQILGSALVSNKPSGKTGLRVVRGFLRNVQNVKKTSQASYDDEVYYFPYFNNYFIELERCYRNIAKLLSSDFRGFISVVNNTHRNFVVPLDKAIIEIWTSLGFNARIESKKEQFHIGTKNPVSRGLRARHTRYIIEVYK